jgi:hypothetical protein
VSPLPAFFTQQHERHYQMADFSLCRRCRALLQVVDGATVHSGCEPMPTELEKLQAAAAADPDNADLTDQINELMTAEPDLMGWALRYATDLGWPVFPLRPVGTRCDGGASCEPVCLCPKEPLTHHGFYDATTDERQIRKWWMRNPRANIGIRTGIAFDVIDVDAPTKKGQTSGLIAYRRMLGAGQLPDIHGRASTARNGLHLYIEPTGEGCTTGLAPNVDYRGVGGYVCAPPSRLAVGRWAWLMAPSPVIRKAGES